MIDCRGIRELLSPYLEDEVQGDVRDAVEKHLRSCGECRTDLELLRRTVQVLRGLPELPPPAGILQGVRRGLDPLPWHRRLRDFLRWPVTGVPLGAVASLLVAVGIFLLYERFPELGRRPAISPSAPPVEFKAPPREESVRPAAPPDEMKKAGPTYTEPSGVATEPVRGGKDLAASAGAEREPGPAEPLLGKPTAAEDGDSLYLREDVGTITEESTPAASDEISPPVSILGSTRETEPPVAVTGPEQEIKPPVPVTKRKTAMAPPVTLDDRRLETVPPPPAAKAPPAEKRHAEAVPLQEPAAPRAAEGEREIVPAPPEGFQAPLPPTASGESAAEERPADRNRLTDLPTVSAKKRSLADTEKRGLLKSLSRSENLAADGTLSGYRNSRLIDSARGETEVLTILSQTPDEMERIRKSLREAEGRLLEMKTLDNLMSRQLAMPYQDQIPPAQVISRGWQIRAAVPLSKVEDFISSIGEQTELQLLHRARAPSTWSAQPGVQNFEINLVR